MENRSHHNTRFRVAPVVTPLSSAAAEEELKSTEVEKLKRNESANHSTIQPFNLSTPGKGLPRRLKVLSWGENPNARGKTVRVGEKSPMARVADEHGLDYKTVWRADKEFLEMRDVAYERPYCEKLGIDEIALRKGHIYST